MNPTAEKALEAVVPRGFWTTGLIGRVAELIDRLHAGQSRASGTPYVVHPIRVAYRVHLLEWLPPLRPRHGKLECVIAALLHDVIEDCDVTAERLVEILIKEIGLSEWSAQRVVAIVLELTQDKSLPRKRRRLKMVLHCSEMSPAAQVIKMSDRIDNLKEMDALSLDFRKEYCAEAKKMHAGLQGANAALAEELLAEIKRHEKILRRSK